MAADNEIQVLLTADLAGLQAGMQAATESVTAASEAITAAVEESATAVEAAQAAIGESAATAADVVSVSMEEAAAATEAAMAQMAESVAAEAAAFNSAVQAKVAAHVRLNAAFAGGVETTAAVAEAEAALDEAMGAGALTATEYAGYVERLNAAELAMAESADAATVAIDANTEAMVINGGVARELGVLMGELARGNTARFEGSLFTLSNRLNLLQYAFSPVGLAAIAAGAAVFAFGAEVVKGIEQSNEFAKALQQTGGAIGITESQFNGMAQAIQSSETTIGTAREAMLKLAQTGKFSGESMETAGKAVVDFAALTGQSIDQAIDAVVKIQERPVQALEKLNEQYHFLSLAQLEHIQKLQDEGDATGAAEEAVKLFQETNTERLAKADEDVGTLIGLWRTLKGAMSDTGDALASIGRNTTIDDQINQAKGHLSKARADANAMPLGLDSAFGGPDDAASKDAEDDPEVKKWEKVLATWQQVKKTQEETGALTKHNQDIQDAGISAQKEDDAMLKGMHSVSAYNDALEKELALKKAIHAANPNDERVKGITFDDKGDATGGEGLEKIKAYLHKKYDVKQEAHARESRASDEAQRKEDALFTNSLEMQRSGTAANTAERIQADAAILASATKMYGAYSQQQKAALDRMLADSKAYDAAVIKDQEAMEKKLEADHAAYVARVQKVSDEAAKKAAASWHTYLDPINRAFQQSIQGMIQGTQTFKQMTQHLLQSIVASYAQAALNELEHHIITQQAKTAATAAGAAERSAIESAAATQSKTADAATGKSQITSAAATGAAKAYQAIVGIPYVGPVLAPIAAGVAFAGIEAFSGMISSARGGWERVPFDGAMTELHKDEMVLPAHIANPMRQMAMKGGQGGGGMVVNLNATDPRGWKDQLRRDPGALANALKLAHRRGHFAR